MQGTGWFYVILNLILVLCKSYAITLCQSNGQKLCCCDGSDVRKLSVDVGAGGSTQHCQVSVLFSSYILPISEELGKRIF